MKKRTQKQREQLLRLLKKAKQNPTKTKDQDLKDYYDNVATYKWTGRE